MPAILIGYLLGTILGFLLKLTILIFTALMRGVLWLIGTIIQLAEPIRQGEIAQSQPPHPLQYSRVLGEDAFGCVIGEDWSDDDRGGNRPEAPEPGPPEYGIEIPTQRLTDAREQRIPGWQEKQTNHVQGKQR